MADTGGSQDAHENGNIDFDAPIEVVDLDLVHADADKVIGNSFSVEVGHLYFDEIVNDAEGAIIRLLEGARPWLNALEEIENQRHQEKIRQGGEGPGRPPTFSTCLLIDDYFLPERVELPTFAELIGAIWSASQHTGVGVNYVMREAACSQAAFDFEDAGSVIMWAPVETFLSRLKQWPKEGQAKLRPDFVPPAGMGGAGGAPAGGSNWFSNGSRTPVSPGLVEAGQKPPEGLSNSWLPPQEYGARNHSVFLDVEVYDEFSDKERKSSGEWRYSCASLAAVWQALRLGELRRSGEVPQAVAFGDAAQWDTVSWSEAPPLLSFDAKSPFAAQQTVSFLHPRFLSTEHAVSALLSGFDRFDKGESAGKPSLVERVSYIFNRAISA